MMASYVGRWSQGHQEQLRFCEKIDQVASRLPLYEVEFLDRLAADLVDTLDRVQSYEENDLFPLLLAMSPRIRPLLVKFRGHHYLDQSTARSLIELLVTAPNLDGSQLSDLKFRMVSFAESLRRHIQFEEAIAMALFASSRVDDRRALQ